MTNKNELTEILIKQYRDNHAVMNHSITVVLMIFTGVCGWLLMFDLLYPKKSWWLSGLWASLYVAAIEGVIGVNVYGLRKVFSTLKEIVIAYSVIASLLLAIVVNMLSEFRRIIFGIEPNPALANYQTWGLFIVPMIGLVQSIGMSLIAPTIKEYRLANRARGKRQEWKWKARRDAYDQPAALKAKQIIMDTEAEKTAFEDLAAQLNEIPDGMRAAFVQRVYHEYGSAGVEAIGGGRYFQGDQRERSHPERRVWLGGQLINGDDRGNRPN